MSDEKLKPCPRCGGQVEVFESLLMDNGSWEFSCDCDGFFKSKEHAIEAANRRHPDPEREALWRELVEIMGEPQTRDYSGSPPERFFRIRELRAALGLEKK